MAKVLGLLVLLVLLFVGFKIVTTGFAVMAAATTMMAVAASVGIFGIFAVGVFTVPRFFLKKKK